MRHPLHPAIVHFPVACWSLAVAADFASLWLDVAAAQWAAQWSGGLLAVGCTMALAAVVAGMIELPRVPEGPAMRVAYVHMGAMLTAFCLFTARLILRLDGITPLAPDTLSLVLGGCGFLALALGGWAGGVLVYGHGVGGDRS